MVDTGTILVGVVIPLVIGPISVFLKTLWDRYNSKEELKRKNIFEEKRDDLSKKINNFYWPVYLKLKTLDRLNYKSCQYKKGNQYTDDESKDYSLKLEKINNTFSDASSDGQDKILYRKRRKKVKKKNYSKLNPESNEINSFSSELENNVKINMTSESYEWDNYDVKPKRISSIREIEVMNDSEFSEIEEEDTKGLLVAVDRIFLDNLDEKILDLCHSIKLLIESNISTVQPSKNLIREIVKFTRYTEMLSIIHNSKKNKYDINKLGVVNNTEKFLLLIKSDLDKYMSNYQKLFNNNYKNDKCSTSCCS